MHAAVCNALQKTRVVTQGSVDAALEIYMQGKTVVDQGQRACRTSSNARAAYTQANKQAALSSTPAVSIFQAACTAYTSFCNNAHDQKNATQAALSMSRDLLMQSVYGSVPMSAAKRYAAMYPLTDEKLQASELVYNECTARAAIIAQQVHKHCTQ